MNKTFAMLSVLFLVFSSFLSSCATDKAAEKRSYDDYMKHGDAWLTKGNYKKAIDELCSAISLNPDSAKAHNMRGVAYFHLGKHRRAEEDFNKAITIDTSYGEAYNNLGGIYFIKKKYDEAKETFLKALSYSPESVSANYSVGTLFLIEGQTEEGTRYIARGIELDPDYLEKQKTFVTKLSYPVSAAAEIYFTYAKLYAATGNVKRALDYLQRADKAGFENWQRISQEKEFETVRENPKIKEFL